VEPFFSMKLLKILLEMENLLCNYSMNLILFLESKLIKDYKFYIILMVKHGLQDLIPLIKDVKNIILWDVDLLNGELFLKLTQMDALPNKLFMKMLGDLLDMLQFVK